MQEFYRFKGEKSNFAFLAYFQNLFGVKYPKDDYMNGLPSGG